ncbi:MAG: phosphatase PAP2 family protein [Spirochaetia bacterium]|nr:phosphatase PAP2 family protein [Spirochaetia bacterium]
MQESILLFFQNIANPFLDLFFEFITMLGEKNILIAGIAWMFWNVDKKKGFLLSFTLLFSLFLNVVLKISIHNSRPFEVMPEILGKRIHTATGYSFPSGHTQGATTFYVVLSLLLKKKWAYVTAVVISVLVAFSRLYLGVHWPIDVIGGLLAGAGIALIMYHVFSTIYDNTVSRDLLVVFSSIGALLILTCFLIVSRFYFAGDLIITDLMKTTGVFTGASVGFILEEKYVKFSTTGNKIKKVFRFVIGFALALVILSGLKVLFPPVDAFHFLRYALSGLWITFLFPCIGKKTGMFL